MSKKKKKKKGQRTERTEARKQEIPIEDDPYWKTSSIYRDAHRVGRFISRFERFEDLHPEWTYDLMNGIPTYYCVLGVERGATKEQIEAAYERKLEFSSYPEEVIEEAFNVLSDPRLQKEYDELLVIFEQVTKSMPPPEKRELVEKHSAYISTEKEFIRASQIMDRYKDYILLYMYGMPDLYEIAGLAKNSTTEEIRRNCRTDTELSKKISTILNDAASREEYDFILDFNAKYADRKTLEEREKYRKKWKRMDRGTFEKIILTALNEPGAIKRYMQRQAEILNSNQDWEQYLPPNKETFLSVLGLDAGSLHDSADKREIERAIRERYRQLERTPEVNLAYSVLKNMSLREDYLWLLENHEMVNFLADLLLMDDVPGGVEIKKEETLSFQEMMDILASVLGEVKEEPPKRANRRKEKTSRNKYEQTTFDGFE